MVDVFPSDLALYLGVDSVDEDRADLLLSLATAECLSIVDPLPDNAKGVILSASARAYTNAQGVQYETVGPYSVQRPWAGLYLTKAERAALRRGNGSGGAFSVDPTPADAGPANSYAQVAYGSLDDPDALGDFDTIPDA